MADLNALGNPPIHYRSLALFFGYLAIATGLILSIIRVINVRYHARQKQNDWNGPQRRKQLYLFAILAALSLGFTWFHMISLFVWSYKNWASSPNGLLFSSIDMPTVTRMGLWLKNTYVFQEAWETVSENPTRFWWSGQIFGWTIGWSIFLGITSRFGLVSIALTASEEMDRRISIHVRALLTLAHRSEISHSPCLGVHARCPSCQCIFCRESFLCRYHCLATTQREA